MFDFQTGRKHRVRCKCAAVVRGDREVINCVRFLGKPKASQKMITPGCGWANRKAAKSPEGGGDDRTRGPRLYRRGRLPKRRNSHGTEQEHLGDHPPGARPGGAAAGRGPGLRLPVRPGLGGEGVLRGAPPRGAPDPGAGGLGGHLPGEFAGEIPPRLGEAAVAAVQLRRGGGVRPARGAGGKIPSSPTPPAPMAWPFRSTCWGCCWSF